jgi:hypothetical protein
MRLPSPGAAVLLAGCATQTPQVPTSPPEPEPVSEYKAAADERLARGVAELMDRKRREKDGTCSGTPSLSTDPEVLTTASQPAPAPQEATPHYREMTPSWSYGPARTGAEKCGIPGNTDKAL